MLSITDKEKIIQLAKKYKLAEVYLFGSSINDNVLTGDIDLAVKGLMPALFFKFYGELFMNLSKPVDLVDLSETNLFNNIIQNKGIRIYG